MAGRKGYQDEIKTKQIIDKSFPIISMALDRKGVYKNLSIETVVDLAKNFVLKAIPDLGKNDNTRISIYVVNQDSEELKFNSKQILSASIPESNPQIEE